MIFQYSNIPIFQYFNIPMFQYSNIPIFQYDFPEIQALMQIGDDRYQLTLIDDVVDNEEVQVPDNIKENSKVIHFCQS